jgi:hypothetical protein
MWPEVASAVTKATFNEFLSAALSKTAAPATVMEIKKVIVASRSRPRRTLMEGAS